VNIMISVRWLRQYGRLHNDYAKAEINFHLDIK